MNPALIAIDPGVTGAVALIHRQATVVRDLPMSRNTFTQSRKHCLHIVALDNLLMDMMESVPDGAPVVFATEQMQGIRGKTSSSTLTCLAEMMGMLEAALRVFCLYSDRPLFIRRYQPRQWMTWMFPDAENRENRKYDAKNDSLELARTLFPKNHPDLTRKKDHNRAEALLIGLTCLAELSGFRVGASLTTGKKLQTVYHGQDAITRQAVFADVFDKWHPLPPVLQKELEHRKKTQPMIKE